MQEEERKKKLEELKHHVSNTTQNDFFPDFVVVSMLFKLLRQINFVGGTRKILHRFKLYPSIFRSWY